MNNENDSEIPSVTPWFTFNPTLDHSQFFSIVKLGNQYLMTQGHGFGTFTREEMSKLLAWLLEVLNA